MTVQARTLTPASAHTFGWAALQPVAWLTLGLLASYAYLYGPAFAASGLTATEALPVPLFPSQAVILAVLLLTARRWWAICLLVYYGVQIAQGRWFGLSLGFNVVSNIANVVEPLVIVLMLSRLRVLPPSFTRLQEVGTYLACSIGASVLGATIGATARATVGYPIWQSWIGWFLANVLASVILAPTIVLWIQAGWRGLRPSTRARAIEAGALCLTLLVLSILVFGTRFAGPETAPALLYLPVPALMWAAVRFGARGAVSALSLVTVLAIAGAANDLGPFVGRSIEANVYTMQVFLFGVGLPLLCLATQVQERQEVQTGLRDSQERYRAVVSNFPHATVLLFGRDLRHLFADGRGLGEMGLSAARVEGRTVSEVFPFEFAAALLPHYEAALDGRESAFELTHDGRTYQAHALPVSYSERTVGMVIMQEITEQRRAEVLAELERAKTVFLSNVSHEFRTPLTMVLGPIEEALRWEESPEQRDRLEFAERNAQRLLKLTNTLLDVAQIEAGRLDATYERADLPAMTDDLASSFRSAIELAGLRLTVECAPLPADVEVYVDRDLWEKIVLNLLSNALKFTFDGTIAVSVNLTRDDRHVELRVRDTGVGIPSAALPRLFERFYRIRGQQARTAEGTGIGLALVQELVKLHGGTISVSSRVGAGTEFVVALPTGSAHLPAERIRDSREVATGETSARAFIDEALRWAMPDARSIESEPYPYADFGGREPASRILVVDDNADIRTYLKRLLGGQYVVDAAEDGHSALQAIYASPPDLVIADVMMSGLSGLDLVRAIRERPETQVLPILLLSARAGEDARVNGLVAGADDYLVKPFGARELLARVAAHLALQKQRQRLLDSERTARAQAEQAWQQAELASQRAAALHAATAALAGAASLQEAGEAVLLHALPVLGAANGTLLLPAQQPDTLTLVAPTGYAADVEQQYLHVPRDAELPAAQAFRTGQPVWIESAASTGSQFPFWTSRPTGNQALAALPLVADGEPLGALVVGFATERVLEPNDRAFLLTLAAQCAAAVRRVQLHAAAERARARAESALRARDEFLRTLAHDLKTPVAGLLWNAQAVRQYVDDDGARDATMLATSASALEQGARELMADIDELRDLVRNGTDEPQLRRRPVDLVRLLNEAIASTVDPTEHSVRLVSCGRELVVVADRLRVQRALGNLLANAFKFSPRASEVVVSVGRAEYDGRCWAVIDVQDQGIGISDADLPYVFDRYFRGEQVRENTLGEGIGLASARQLVEWHGGRLTVTSVEGAGSTFRIWLPAT